jgi:hypothetical protein
MSAQKRVLVHDCAPQFDDGRRLICACAHRVTSRDADEMVAAGQAQWKFQRTAGRGLVEVHRELILRKPIPAERNHPINARVMSERDVLDAYVENEKYARERIEIVGEMQVDALVELGAAKGQV